MKDAYGWDGAAFDRWLTTPPEEREHFKECPLHEDAGGNPEDDECICEELEEDQENIAAEAAIDAEKEG